MPSLSAAMAVSRSAIVFSSSFFLSSAVSNCVAQYSFFSSSSTCSFFRVSTISSIILITFSKPIFLPVLLDCPPLPALVPDLELHFRAAALPPELLRGAVDQPVPARHSHREAPEGRLHLRARLGPRRLDLHQLVRLQGLVQ